MHGPNTKDLADFAEPDGLVHRAGTMTNEDLLNHFDGIVTDRRVTLLGVEAQLSPAPGPVGSGVQAGRRRTTSRTRLPPAASDTRTYSAGNRITKATTSSRESEPMVLMTMSTSSCTGRMWICRRSRTSASVPASRLLPRRSTSPSE